MTFQLHNKENGVSSQREGSASWPLHINFDCYTDGDPEYKKELGLLIIDNLKELRQSLADSVHQDNPRVFLDALHKVQVTLRMLEDKEFNKTIAELKKDIEDPDDDSRFMTRSIHFRDICDLIITSLTKEIDASGI